MTVRVRFAPSPTGHLHIGGLRSALFNWLFARHEQGAFLIRIEDTDRERSKPEYTQTIIDSFAWVGITPDEPIVIQSERLEEHKKILTQLLNEDKAYRCYCTPEQVSARVGIAGADEQFIKYDGACRTRSDQPDIPYAIRFKLPDTLQRVTFHDLVRGDVTFERDQLDDFIIARSDGWPIYNFVVVVDDAFMRVTHVIRAEEHIPNTPKQILLAQACGYPVPQFAHLSVILGPDGSKLSKRDGAMSVLEYRDLGYLPDALINYIARLGWAHGDQEVFTRDELIRYFTLSGVGKKAAVFDIQKLQWMNGVYIKQSAGENLLAYITQYLDAQFRKKFSAWSDEQVIKAIDLYKERVVTLRELMSEVDALYSGPQSYDAIMLNEIAQSNNVLDQLIIKLDQHNDFTAQALGVAIKDLGKQLNIKFVEIAHPIRIALLGKNAGPGVFELIALVGKKSAIDRLRALRAAL